MHPTLSRAAMRLALGSACALPLACAAAQNAECTLSPVGKLPLRYSGPYLEITTQGSINGTPAEMLVGLGVYQTVLTRTGVERHGLKTSPTGSRIAGLGGTSSVYATRLDEFSVGPIRTGRTTLPVMYSLGFMPTYDAILGATLLLQADLEISLATREMTFFVAKNCEASSLGYWGETVREIPLRRHDQDDLNPRFDVRINGTRLQAQINTGSSVSSMSVAAARRAGIAFETPGARADDVPGLGNSKASRWLATVKTFQIGEETVQDAEFTVMDSVLDGYDVTLGADFLRSHRVLFAMSQDKLYFSYVGGVPFSQRNKIEPWIEAEANSGNADAQLELAQYYGGSKQVPRDEVRMASWLEKAAASGSPRALLGYGEVLVRRREYAAAVPRLRAALDKLPAEREGALTLYIARVKTGQAELAKSELAATFARNERDEWPKPVADFYLGKLTGDKLLALAADDGEHGRKRRCSALSAMGDWHRAHGQAEAAKALDTELKATCSDTGQTFTSLGD